MVVLFSNHLSIVFKIYYYFLEALLTGEIFGHVKDVQCMCHL